METESKGKRYLVQIKYSADMSSMERIRESTPGIKTILEDASKGNCKLAWTTADGSSFGFFLRTEKSAHWLYTELMSPGQHSAWGTSRDEKPGRASPMRSGDSILVVELGEELAGNGFSNTWAWLQRH